ncbi:MAG: hypothetical protein LHW64_03460 [Candidatus Cloacimonetes bacterium]|nr:hypothetical protein [Candidatus Cloacimonadota bacterium]MDY0229165.1 hypothetical protein [Candidatus Cloacimonadaceae bacterium]
MKAICIIDTTIFLEILNVPNKAAQHKQTMAELKEKISAGEFLFLPMPTIIETGNHIAQNGDGDQRRKAALRFVNHIEKALEGDSPFTPIDFLTSEKLKTWLKEFPDSAMRGSGLGDLSIIKDWERQCKLHKAMRVYIWSLDEHLSAYELNPRILA